MYTGFLLSLADTIPETFSEKLSYGLQMLILGILMVFAVLGIIFLALIIFHFVCHTLPEKMKKNQGEAAPVAPTPAAVQTNDEEIVAVIAAAIAAAENELPDARFRVVSFRRIS